MGKPRMIILIRHAQSEGNKNREIHQTVPDHRVKLTNEGHKQAREAGRKLRALLRPEDTLHFFTSPYRRTRETTEGILESLTYHYPQPTPFNRKKIKVYEEPRLREQDFGNFQPCSEEMERMWQERADYGHFFYRIPNGESAADAYDRVSGFNDTLYRLFGEEDFASVCVLVTHGLMSRIFLMKWYHFSVEYFEDLRNVNHCEFIVLKQAPDTGRYILQNQLRTWSQLRQDLAAKGEQFNAAGPRVAADAPIPVRRKYVGCRDGWTSRSGGAINASSPLEATGGGPPINKKTPRRKNTADLFRENDEADEDSDDPSRPPVFVQQLRAGAGPMLPSSSADRTDDEFPLRAYKETIVNARPPSSATSSVFSPTEIGHQHLLRRQAAASPYHQSLGLSLIELGGGRDGGGSLSGAASLVASSDDDDSKNNSNDAGLPYHGTRNLNESTQHSNFPGPRSLGRALHGDFASRSLGSRRDPNRAMADALGDQSDASVDGEDDENDGGFVDQEEQHRLKEELERDKRADQSLRNSVY